MSPQRTKNRDSKAERRRSPHAGAASVAPVIPSRRACGRSSATPTHGACCRWNPLHLASPHRSVGSCYSRAVCIAVVEAQPGDRFDVDRYAALKPCAADMLKRLVSGASLHLVVRRAACLPPLRERALGIVSLCCRRPSASLRLPLSCCVRLVRPLHPDTPSGRHHCRAVVGAPDHRVPEKQSDIGNPRVREISFLLHLLRLSTATAVELLRGWRSVSVQVMNQAGGGHREGLVQLRARPHPLGAPCGTRLHAPPDGQAQGAKPGPAYRVQVRCDLDSHGLVSLAPALCESSIVICAFRSRLQAAFLPPGTAPRSP